MVKGSSSQASTAVARGGRASTGAPGGGSVVRRRTGRTPGSSGRIRESVMNFYTDDSPGLKVPPVAVIVMSLAFILFVTVLHIVGKLTS